MSYPSSKQPAGSQLSIYARLVSGVVALLVFIAELIFIVQLFWVYLFDKGGQQIHPAVYTLAMLAMICYFLALMFLSGFRSEPASHPRHYLYYRSAYSPGLLQLAQNVLGYLLVVILWLHFLGFFLLFLLVAHHFILQYDQPELTRYFIMIILSGGVALMGFVLGRTLQGILPGIDHWLDMLLNFSVRLSALIYLVLAVAQIGMWLVREMLYTMDGMQFSPAIILALSLFIVNAGFALFLSTEND